MTTLSLPLAPTLLTPIPASAAYTALSGDLVQMTGQFTVTLPAPLAGRCVGVISVNGTQAAPCTVSTPSGVILGPGIPGTATSILLESAAAFVLLEADGTNWNVVGGGIRPIGSSVAYQEFTAPVTISGASEALATTIVTAPAFTADGVSSYWVEFYAPAALPGTNDTIIFVLYDGAASLGFLSELGNASTAVNEGPILLRRKLTPGAASKTYSIRGWRIGANGTVTAGAGGAAAFVPGYINVTKAT